MVFYRRTGEKEMKEKRKLPIFSCPPELLFKKMSATFSSV